MIKRSSNFVNPYAKPQCPSERYKMERHGFNPDSEADRKLWRAGHRIHPKLAVIHGLVSF